MCDSVCVDHSLDIVNLGSKSLSTLKNNNSSIFIVKFSSAFPELFWRVKSSTFSSLFLFPCPTLCWRLLHMGVNTRPPHSPHVKIIIKLIKKKYTFCNFLSRTTEETLCCADTLVNIIGHLWQGRRFGERRWGRVPTHFVGVLCVFTGGWGWFEACQCCNQMYAPPWWTPHPNFLQALPRLQSPPLAQ